MTNPDSEDTFRRVVFHGDSLREAMTKLLNWLDEPSGATYTKEDGEELSLGFSNDFYDLPETLHVDYSDEFGEFQVSIMCGEIYHGR